MGKGWRLRGPFSMESRSGSRRGRSGRAKGACVPIGLAAACGTGTQAGAADLGRLSLESLVDQSAFAGLSLVVGLVLFSTITALLHLAARRRWTEREQDLSSDLADARARIDRAEVFLAAEPQIIVAWRSATGEPDIEGDLTLITDAVVSRRILGFGSWLPPAAAQALEHAVDRLRARGEGFRMATVTVAGRHLELEGRAVAGRAILRIRDVSGDRLELTRMRERHGQVTGELEARRAMLDVVPDPAWMRDAAGELAWVNTAFGTAVEAKNAADAVLRKQELLDQPARHAAEAARTSGEPWIARASAVVAGERHVVHVVEVAGSGCAAGIAIDLSELEAARAELQMQTASHARTLDQLSTAVAIFDRGKRLVFHNAAYRSLWSLDANFLDSRPLDGEILDRLRSEGRLPEQVDYRAWRSGLMSAYHATEPMENPWYLPDGRTQGAVTNPNPNGGITYLFDDITERYHLEAQYNALIRVQGETLDTLKEGVSVFGTDGRLKLFNPAFADLWRLDPLMLAERPHVDDVARRCQPLCGDNQDWVGLRAIVAGLEEERRGFEDRLHRTDGIVLDYAAVPLPDGATLLTFTNVTAGVSVERVLKERNKALVDAEKLRNDFVHHVSYELRSPLTNIIGFVQLLGDRSVGSLNAKQQEYAGYVTKSSAALLAIINDILDLATIDMDAMQLEFDEIDISRTMQDAAAGVQDRLVDAGIDLRLVALDGIGTFRADGKRVRQVLYNLLSNAIGFSAPGQSVTLAALRRGDQIVFKVTDQGRGIPPEILDRVFDRFHADTSNSRHRGVGLGLSIVRAFVELHHGKVLIDSAPGEGTSVTCIFPENEAAAVAVAPAATGGPVERLSL